ncbi:MAG: MotA/TolQ/ExbB proton channel family protein [Bacillota bacterium]|nr:MotA/TolQ/ExbB proton channel family protein [Bacillota bacterium]
MTAAIAAAAEDTFKISDILRAVASGLQIPVIIILILIMAATVFLAGWLVSEGFSERRHLKVALPELLDRLRQAPEQAAETIEESGLLRRQKAALTELTRHPDFTPVMREALAVSLVAQEQARYDRMVKYSELISRLGPVFGLLGTLIPLGPGIIALGQGDTYALSESLLIAFDTTIAGLISAAVATVISTIRRSWYRQYMTLLEALAECVLETEKLPPAGLPAAEVPALSGEEEGGR